VAAGAGTITMTLLAHTELSLTLPAYNTIAPIDLLSASVIAFVAAVLGVLGASVFSAAHR